MILQKVPSPNIDDLPVPAFESETKKAQIKVTNKAMVAPIVEGTSVMPRQRPKGSSSAPLNLNSLPLTLSPSPTTVKKPESPVAESHFQSFQQKPVPQPPFTVAPGVYYLLFTFNFYANSIYVKFVYLLTLICTSFQLDFHQLPLPKIFHQKPTSRQLPQQISTLPLVNQKQVIKP